MIANSYFEGKKRPLLVAHRGASGHAPENTMAAFRLALEMKVDAIELDIHMSKDGEIVVIHDPTLDRTTNGTGRVGGMTLAKLQALDAGSWFNAAFPDRARPEHAGQRIPTLHDVLRLVGRRAALCIEIKDPDLYPANLGSKLLSIIRQHRMQDRVVLLSFNRKALIKVRSLDPLIRTGLLVGRVLIDPVKAALSLRANALGIRYKLLTSSLVAEALESGLNLIVWTVDNPEDLSRMIDAQVDSIVTNYPGRFIQLVS